MRTRFLVSVTALAALSAASVFAQTNVAKKPAAKAKS